MWSKRTEESRAEARRGRGGKVLQMEVSKY